MKIKVTEFADIRFTTEKLPLSKAKKKKKYYQVTSASPGTVREFCHINYLCHIVDASVSLKMLTKKFKIKE